MPRLDLRITDLGAKRAWLETLDALLRDAPVLGSSRWDLRSMRYELDLRRVAYGPQISAYGRPWVPCRLTIAPVLSVIDGRGSQGRSLGEYMEAIQLRDRRELALLTTGGTARLRLGDAPQLEIRDIGPPIEDRSTVGLPALATGRATGLPWADSDSQRVGQLLRARVL
ncbi:MAG: hypothetical protein AAGE94_14870 [Acidobacteriota bacterium]